MVKLGWHSLGTSFDCPCGIRHELPIEACYLGEGAAARLAAFAREKCGKTCLIVSDANTRHAGGERLLSALSGAGKTCTEHVFGSDPFEATEELGEVVARAGMDADFFVGLGSGTLCDLAKYAGHKLKRPTLLYATAASMNGYTSSIVAMKIRGLKRTSPVQPALGVFADPDVVATAPIKMAAAGVGDFLSKNSSSSDWYAAHFLRDEYYCSRPGDFFEGTQEKLLEAAPRVARRDPEAVGIVLEALLLAGFSMVVAGSSAPASGGEHLISHYLDMKHATKKTPNDLHGAQVGVATVYTLELWEKVLALDPARIDPEALAGAHPDDETIHRWIDADWGSVGPEVWAQWQQKTRDREGLRREIERFRDGLPALRDALKKELLPSATVAEAIRASGGAVDAEGLLAPVEEYRNAQRFARYLRNRFTILDLAAELGVT
ncbi:MAG TPA: iron-containing alcohol dehydrogenase [Candidatus Hydrogenedentes bacterium]|nr:iron-containing alcohol dehydrogenase [Candidatus Hydrogenedentota bacterium]HRT20609.1 iron-containing alcohol dehydrogenase [Candidatus Hydrogenedentota bacterium]HRT65384.1 iron-containing alcohol dehydrogenase [Candidatus Hydrogenedentota bacterium]